MFFVRVESNSLFTSCLYGPGLSYCQDEIALLIFTSFMSHVKLDILSSLASGGCCESISI